MMDIRAEIEICWQFIDDIYEIKSEVSYLVLCGRKKDCLPFLEINKVATYISKWQSA